MRWFPLFGIKCSYSTLRSYPCVHSFAYRTPISEFKSKFNHLQANEWLSKQDYITLCGRILLKRSAGKKLLFLKLHQGQESVQIALNASEYETIQEDQSLSNLVSLGDIVKVTGYPGKTIKEI